MTEMLTQVTATVAASAASGKSAFISRDSLLQSIMSGGRPLVSLVFGTDLVGTETKIRWYASLTGEAGSEFEIYTDSTTLGQMIETSIPSVGNLHGVEVSVARFLRWPYLMLEMRSAGAVVPKAGGARVVTFVAAGI